jgi:hypothetical protein
MRRVRLFTCILVLLLAVIGSWSAVSAAGDIPTEKDKLIKMIRSGRLPEKADLRGADLSIANLPGANLRGANLRHAYLKDAFLVLANLRGANLRHANLTGVELGHANLTGANLGHANLTDANLEGANLTDASLRGAALTGADLGFADLTDANLRQAILNGVTYEPEAGTLPLIPPFATTEGLPSLRFTISPHGLHELREALKKAGMRRQEREVTYAIEHTKRLKAWEEGFEGKAESVFKLVLFELTCEYGMSPGRALRILAMLVPLFALPYIVSLRMNRQDGIWKVWSDERMRKDLGSSAPERITAKPNASIFIGLYFSMLSAFHIGWRDLNVGNWIARIQSREYTLRATGWVRTISGIQSLISVYLIAIWALTYFGRPFE